MERVPRPLKKKKDLCIPEVDCVVVRGIHPHLLDVKLRGEKKESAIRSLADRFVSEQHHKLYAPATKSEQERYGNNSDVLIFKDCILGQECPEGHFPILTHIDSRTVFAKQSDIDTKIFRRKFGDPTPLFSTESTFKTGVDFMKKFYEKARAGGWIGDEFLTVHKEELGTPPTFKQYIIQSHYCTTNYVISTTGQNSNSYTLTAADRPPCVQIIPVDLLDTPSQYVGEFGFEDLEKFNG